MIFIKYMLCFLNDTFNVTNVLNVGNVINTFITFNTFVTFLRSYSPAQRKIVFAPVLRLFFCNFAFIYLKSPAALYLWDCLIF